MVSILLKKGLFKGFISFLKGLFHILFKGQLNCIWKCFLRMISCGCMNPAWMPSSPCAEEEPRCMLHIYTVSLTHRQTLLRTVSSMVLATSERRGMVDPAWNAVIEIILGSHGCPKPLDQLHSEILEDRTWCTLASRI